MDECEGEVYYNNHIMSFLKYQLDKVQHLQKPLGARPEDCEDFDKQVAVGRRLLAKHTEVLDIRHFYSSRVARDAVESVCVALNDILQEGQLQHEVGIEEKIPYVVVKRDEKHLDLLLSYILRDKEYDLPEEIRVRWDLMKSRHKDNLRLLRVIDENELDMRELIGEGSIGVVQRAMWRSADVAVKKILQEGELPILRLAELFKEGSVHASLNHPNIVKLYGITTSGWMVMEMAIGDLGGLCHSGQKLPWSKVLKLLRQGAAALEYMHHRKPALVHSDVKPANLLIFGTETEDLSLKVSDFSVSFEERGTRQNSVRLGGATPRYIAPEISLHRALTTESDVFSFGVVMFEAVSGKHPYGRKAGDLHQLYLQKADEVPPCPVGERDCPPEMLQLMARCCAADPKKRPTMEEVRYQLCQLAVDWVPTVPRYNQQMLDFLATQLAEVSKLKQPKGATEASVKELKDAIRDGDRLLRKHKELFDLKTYYSCNVVKKTLNNICEKLCRVVRDWKQDDTIKVEERVPEPCFRADRQELCKLLAYILEVGQTGTEVDVPAEWETIKHRHEDQLKDLKFIDEKEIEMGDERGRGSGSIIHEGMLGSLPVAIKKCRIHKSIETDVELLGEFMKDVIMHLSLLSCHVAQLYAITKKSCWLVMELADKDLGVFCQDRKAMSWSMKLNLLQQAAERLHHMHSHDPPLVHSDIKTSNFLVFGNEPIVKIADFGQTRESTDTMKMTVRKVGGTHAYKPPEAFRGAAFSLPGDVYSFGIVLYEVVTGRVLYEVKGPGRMRSEQYIMAQKVRGVAPCELCVNDCPKAMEELMKECCHEDPTQRPEMQEVCDRLKKMPTDFGEKNPVEDLHHIVDAAGRQMPHVHYNKRVLSFLLHQMESVKSLTDLPPEMSSDAWTTLKGALEAGEHLIKKHTCTFDLQKFYTVDELKALVESLCRNLQESMCCIDDDDSVSDGDSLDEYAVQDRGFLNTCLHFVLFGEQALGDSSELGDEWHQVRRKHCERMESVQVIPDDEIDLEGAEEISTGGEGTVYKIQWRGQAVAAKRLTFKRKDQKMERLAHVFTEAALSASMKHAHVASVLAVSESGSTLVMELATENLMDWYRRHKKAPWKSKVAFMHQAASGLAHMHNRTEALVHCDVKTTNFLVFADDPNKAPIVKVCDFGTLTTQATNMKTTMRQQPRTALYCAPEIYDRQPHTQKSDVFSFGVVLCEVAAQRSPYKGEKGLVGVMMMKQNDKMPCRIPPSCPEGLRRLIERCLSRNPEGRPSMEDVEETLRNVLHKLDPDHK